ncbi:hypothetical protein RJT34_04145 [Clitoria ternatea]|uniref:Uncharacterized protein n=1 Tax=Clitoria ternatea TaxID=43366 RepID=A0AAN9KLG2_CLITE
MEYRVVYFSLHIVSPHIGGIRNGPKTLKPVPVLVLCNSYRYVGEERKSLDGMGGESVLAGTRVSVTVFFNACAKAKHPSPTENVAMLELKETFVIYSGLNRMPEGGMTCRRYYSSIEYSDGKVVWIGSFLYCCTWLWGSPASGRLQVHHICELDCISGAYKWSNRKMTSGPGYLSNQASSS